MVFLSWGATRLGGKSSRLPSRREQGKGARVPVDHTHFEHTLRTLFDHPGGVQAHEDLFQNFLKQAASDSYVEQTRAMRGQRARNALLAISEWLDNAPGHPLRSKALYVIVKVAAEQGRDMPWLLNIRGVRRTSHDNHGGGGFGLIYPGVYHGRTVAIKKIELNINAQRDPDEVDRAHKQVTREAFVWRHIRHPNVLEFIGLDVENFPNIGMPCIVTPWMRHGDLKEYLRRQNPVHQIRERLIAECAAGLRHLHSHNIVHGDVRAPNYLVDDHHHAVLSDFGLVNILDKVAPNLITYTAESGATRFKAPELHKPEAFHMEFQRTFATDVYSFGSLILEVFSGAGQFPGERDAKVVQLVLSRTPPPRPSAAQCRGLPMPDIWWELTLRCLKYEIAARPTMEHVARMGRVQAKIAQGDSADSHLFKIVAIYNYSQRSSQELSFREGQELEVIAVQPGWYRARDESNREGSVPQNFFHEPESLRATASSTSHKLSHAELSVRQGENLRLLKVEGKWWTAKKADGTVGFISPMCVRLDLHGGARKAKAQYTYQAAHPNQLSLVKGSSVRTGQSLGDWTVVQKTRWDQARVVPSVYFDLT